MPVSQNGWVTIDSSQLDKSPIPGTNVVPVPGLKKGDVATILLHVGKRFNERVEKVYNPGCWGWNTPIPIPGSNVISNHGSGTAIDLNAPSFPWKMYRMSSAQRQACRSIVNELENVVTWGGDFPTYVDEMHFDINGDASEEDVARVANKIRQGSSSDEGEEMVTLTGLKVIYRFALGEEPSEYGLTKRLGKQTFDEAFQGVISSPRYKAYVERHKNEKTIPVKNLPQDVRQIFNC